MKLNELLQRYRRDQALTQEQMAFKIGINRCLYNRLEKGETNVSAKTIQKIAETLKIDPSQITELLKGE